MPLMTLYRRRPRLRHDRPNEGEIPRVAPPRTASPSSLGYRPNDPLGGTWITPTKSPPRVKIELGRPKDEREAEFRLSFLADYVDEKN